MSSPTLGGWLVHVMRQADAALSLEESLHSILDSMKEYYPCQSVAVILIDEDTKALRIKISRQISYTFVKKFHRDGPSPVAEKIVLEQEPMLFNNVDPSSDTYQQLKLEHDLSSAVLAPVVKDKRGVGYIFCDRKDGEQFTDSDLLHLQVIGYLVGSIIEKFELLKQRKTLSQVDDASNALQYKAFIPAMVTELARAQEHDYAVSLSLISVDAFRRYVETHGIDKAHELLAEVVEITKTHIRELDTLARFGADEFILCLSGTDSDQARAKLEELRHAIRETAVGQGDDSIDLTVGALTLRTGPDKKRSIQDILATLGRALVQAKGSEDGEIVATTFS